MALPDGEARVAAAPTTCCGRIAVLFVCGRGSFSGGALRCFAVGALAQRTASELRQARRAAARAGSTGWVLLRNVSPKRFSFFKKISAEL